MKTRIRINSLIKWTREKAGFLLEQEIEKFRNFHSFPTYSQLEQLAKRYNRLLAIFFFSEPNSTSTPNIFSCI